MIKSIFGWRTTADEVAEGVDLSGKTAIVTGANTGMFYLSFQFVVSSHLKFKHAFTHKHNYSSLSYHLFDHLNHIIC